MRCVCKIMREKYKWDDTGQLHSAMTSFRRNQVNCGCRSNEDVRIVLMLICCTDGWLAEVALHARDYSWSWKYREICEEFGFDDFETNRTQITSTNCAGLKITTASISTLRFGNTQLVHWNWSDWFVYFIFFLFIFFFFLVFCIFNKPF